MERAETARCGLFSQGQTERLKDTPGQASSGTRRDFF
ncbi:hypothetical protein CA54_47430 [Symmachiella macrocystis]|uniref:Uncharacterized protein n=1 Tax=Symmachiella macrocystis TaxID=2527985 RepID=A0A5C6BDB5_9PLAN|nr:hypothetical protein CA54_47430 [Symmachiella macrocystis]